MPLLHSWVAQVEDARHVVLPLINGCTNFGGDLITFQTAREQVSSFRILHDLLVHLLHWHLTELSRVPLACGLGPFVDEIPEFCFFGTERQSGVLGSQDQARK